MIMTKTRTALVALAASTGFAIAGIAPATSQAQWHNYCIAGHCITHANYTIQGEHPCGPADVTGTNPQSGLSDATQPITDEEKAAQAEQDALNQFEGLCPN